MVISKDTSTVVKGVAIILIVIHHYTQNFGFLPVFFKGVGPMACSAFFLISGYGLSVNKGSYTKWKGRLSKLYVPFVLSNFLYILLGALMGIYMLTPVKMITDFLGVTLVNGHCWFLQYLIIFYLLTAIIDVFFPDNRHWLVPVMSLIGGGIFMCVSHAPGTLSWIAFPLGFIINKIEFCRSTLEQVGLGLFGFLSFIIYYSYGCMRINTPFLLVNFVLMCITIPVSMILLGESCKKFKLLKVAGENSIDIYLMHGIVINILIAKQVHFNAWCIIIYLVSIVIIAFLFNKVQKHFLNAIRVRL